MTEAELRTYVRDIPDFPKPGIVFKDITPLLAAGAALQDVVEKIADRYRGSVDMVLGIESRGFIIGAAVAYRLGLGLALVRKPGKLPHQTYAARYELEYGSDTLEIHRDAFGRQEPRPHRRRLAGDRRHGVGGDRAGPAARRRGRRLRFHHRARVPERPEAAGRPGSVLADPLRRRVSAGSSRSAERLAH